ncbi:helix-turn-helix transcriptional regulator [Paenibacillus mesophilus]|uniref:helix-turn-helix domain-containing protein n=1 Tax=Paenibacillus mesophilus TaxID=2582849 RepID=UPI00110E4D2C|nr:helix-turn-helix transcriptional regulator [Paenibacillus mesophilus]TMV47550.1 helix-turn-helix transcriptional regulator [Paenibacillus mesophilus]
MALHEMGKRIVRLRHQQGLTQEQLGQQLNVSGQAVSKWENGDSLPDTALLLSLAQALECTTDYLLGADTTGGVNRLLPMLEGEVQGMDPGGKIDLAFKLFKLVDAVIYDVGKSAGFETSVLGHGMPFVHAGPHITVWWKGKFLCIATKEALKETETIYQEEKLPFDLFPDDWDALITTFLTQGTPFDSKTAIKETDLRHAVSADADLTGILDAWMDCGILQKGRGGYQTGARAEVLLRLLGLLLRSTGMPGVLSVGSSNPPKRESGEKGS